MAKTLRDVPTEFLQAVDRLKKTASPKLRKALEAAIADARGEFATLLETLSPEDALAVQQTWDNLLANLTNLYSADGALLAGMVSTGESVAETIAADWSVIESGFGHRALIWLEEYGAKKVTRITEETRLAVKQVIVDSYSGPLNLRKAARRLVELPGLGLDRVQMVGAARAKDPTKPAGGFEKFVQDTLKRGDENDWTSSQIQFALDQRYKKLAYHRARRIAITEASNAGNASVDLTIREAVAKGLIDPREIELEWVTRVVNACPICEAFDGTRRPLTGGLFVSNVIKSGKYAGKRLSFERPTVHPHCFPGWQPVQLPPGDLHAVTERLFQGVLITVETSSGKLFSCTPNHPVLTRRGWVPAGQLMKGGDVVRCLGLDQSTVHDDYHHGPTRIEEVARTFGQSQSVASREVEVAPEDFHGDGVSSEVAVIRSHRELRGENEAALLQQLTEEFLVSVQLAAALHGEGALHFGRHRFGLAALRTLRGSQASNLFLRAFHLAPHLLRLCKATHGSPRGFQESPNDAPVDARFLGDPQFGDAGEVAVDQIVSIRQRDWSGHVYNLQTEKEWYSAGGIVVHNCYCGTRTVRIGD